jgi:hypothetical protein
MRATCENRHFNAAQFSNVDFSCMAGNFGNGKAVKLAIGNSNRIFGGFGNFSQGRAQDDSDFGFAALQFFNEFRGGTISQTAAN